MKENREYIIRIKELVNEIDRYWLEIEENWEIRRENEYMEEDGLREYMEEQERYMLENREEYLRRREELEEYLEELCVEVEVEEEWGIGVYLNKYLRKNGKLETYWKKVLTHYWMKNGLKKYLTKNGKLDIYNRKGEEELIKEAQEKI